MVNDVTARRVFTTFKFDPVEDENKIVPVLAKFEAYCRPKLNIPFEGCSIDANSRLENHWISMQQL